MKYRLPVLILVLAVTAVGIVLFQSKIELATPSSGSNKPNCSIVKQCLRADHAWPPGMESCSKTLAPGTIRTRGKDGKLGYSMNFEGCSKDPIIPPQFDTAEKFGQNGLAKVSRDGKWGYVNLKGDPTILLHFDEVGDFDHGLVPVKLKNQWSYLDAQGRVVGTILFDAVSGIWRDNLSAVQSRGKWGYVNPLGTIVVEPGFDKVTEFQKGFAKVEVNQKWGIINTAGEKIIEPAFDAIFSTNDEKLFLVVLNQKYGYVNSEGKEIIPPLLLKPVKARYIDKGVQVVLNAETLTDSPADGSDHSIRINTWHYLDGFNRSNDKVRFDENGKAQFLRQEKWFYINQAGKLIPDQ